MEQEKLSTKFAPAERADNEQVQRSFQLIQNVDYFNKLFSVVPNIILILNKERQVVFCNQALFDLLNLSNYDQILGQRPGELFNCIHSSEMPQGCGTTEFCSTCGAVNTILNTLNTKKRDVQECRMTVKKGNEIDSLDLKISTDLVTIEGEDFITFHIMDISDEKRRKILERIFFHDVLNTAGVINGITQVINDVEDKQTFDEFIYSLNHSSNKLIQEIQNQRLLLDAENNELTVSKTKISSHHFLTELINEYSNHEAAKERNIALNPASEDIVFNIDNLLLGRVIGNLLKNALEASLAGKTITLASKRINDKIEFSVHNQIFIPREIQLQIFQRSFSTKGTNRGIGTYSIKLLTERYLKGSVSFESAEDTGTTFFARYPLE